MVSNSTPTPLCDSLLCVHPHNEGIHRGLLPRRGPSVRSAPLACPRSSCLTLSSGFFHCHCHTPLPFTCAFLSCIARGSDPRFRIVLISLSAGCGIPSLMTWLCTSLSAGLPRWSLLLSSRYRASGTSGTDSSAAYPWPWSFSRSLSLKLAGSRSATNNLLEVGMHCPWRLSCCLLDGGHQQSLDFAASHHLGHLCFSWHLCCNSTTVFCAALTSS